MTTQTNSLQPAARHRFLSGFGNLLRSENIRNWGGRRWIMPAATSLVVINGLVLLLALAGRSDPTLTIEETAVMANSVFFQIGMIVTALAVIIRTQSAIIGEKQLGTAAWVLSKPTSRSAFVLTKWLAFSISTLVLSLAIPAAIFLLQSQLFWNETPSPIRFVMGMLIMVLHLQFYLGLTLMLGTIYQSRGPVTGISLSILLSGVAFSSLFPQWVSVGLPWLLPTLAPMVVVGQPLPAMWPVPIIANLIWIALFMGFALWRFRREEF